MDVKLVFPTGKVACAIEPVPMRELHYHSLASVVVESLCSVAVPSSLQHQPDPSFSCRLRGPRPLASLPSVPELVLHPVSLADFLIVMISLLKSQ